MVHLEGTPRGHLRRRHDVGRLLDANDGRVVLFGERERDGVSDIDRGSLEYFTQATQLVLCHLDCSEIVSLAVENPPAAWRNVVVREPVGPGHEMPMRYIELDGCGFLVVDIVRVIIGCQHQSIKILRAGDKPIAAARIRDPKRRSMDQDLSVTIIPDEPSDGAS